MLQLQLHSCSFRGRCVWRGDDPSIVRRPYSELAQRITQAAGRCGPLSCGDYERLRRSPNGAHRVTQMNIRDGAAIVTLRLSTLRSGRRCGAARRGGCVHPRWAGRLSFEQRSETRTELWVTEGVYAGVEQPPWPIVVHRVIKALHHRRRRRPGVVIVCAATLNFCLKVLCALVAVVCDPHVAVKRSIGRFLKTVLRLRACAPIAIPTSKS
eukprot:scaffold9425_cov61-Phaeocystis_antarctica.AAC.3